MKKATVLRRGLFFAHLRARYFICTEPETFTVTVDVPPSSGTGADIFASAEAARALIIIMGRGITPECPTFTSRIV